MICFRDKTFCTANCVNHSCDDKLTKQVSADADRWWPGEGAPISTNDFSHRCKNYKPEEKK